MKIKNFKVLGSTSYILESVLEKYTIYINKLENLTSNQLTTYLRAMRTQELINNQILDNEDSFMITAYNLTKRNTSIKILEKLFSDKELIGVKDIDSLHSRVIEGTKADKEENYGFRNPERSEDDDTWVGHFDESGNKIIEYMPIPSKDVINDMQNLCDYINSDNQHELDLFIKPILIHGWLAVSQPFNDGNTRTARLLQYGELWKQTNKKYNLHFKEPAFYFSKKYLLYRESYRGYIKDLAVQDNNDAMNRWIRFNANMIDEELNTTDDRINKFIKVVK